jgi:molybdate transport system substrate-binding protein
MKKIFILILCLFATFSLHAELTVFAAASTTNVMKDLAVAYEEQGGSHVIFNFASSGALARQIDAGAPADVFVSANVKWMTFLNEKELIKPSSITTVAHNALVLISPPGKPFDVEMTSSFDFSSAFEGLLAVGDFKSVPAGAYAKQSLEALGWFSSFEERFVKGNNVRKVLLFVEKDEAGAGIVYSTDAVQSGKVEILGTFPEDTHKPIVYPAGVCKSCDSESFAFVAFLGSSEAKEIWHKYGFLD